MNAPTSHRLLLSTGLRYHMLEWPGASPAAPTVMLLHGFLDFAWTWEAVVEQGLAGPMRVLAPDLRGHGDSDPVGAGGYYHFLDYLADLHDLVDWAGQGSGGAPLCLVGHSMGGSIAAYYAGVFPQRVHRLVLLEGLGPPEDVQEVPDRVAVWIAAWRRARASSQKGYPDVEAAAARLRAHDPLLGEDLARRLAQRGTRPGPDGQIRFKHDPLHLTPGPLPFRTAMAETFWRRISCPVLIVDGEVSSFRHPPEEAARRRGFFANSKYAVLAGAGHMMQRHQPAALAQLLRDFLLGS
ncbi:MAG: alpha/beta hydrolase [Myxococcales bacterium]|nr:alpha/beta hydrolase [Myxococcota bacterium]MDW8284321.1 alpha/beta hydrolase [Myxococcales bacterium]